MTSLAFFSNKGGGGQTTLVAHLAWMLAERGVPVLAVDLDPQANLSSMFLADERLQELWQSKKTLLAALEPLMTRKGDIAEAHVEPVARGLDLLVGDLRLSRFEDLLAENWSKCLTGEIDAFRVMSAFYRVIRSAAQRQGTPLVLIDLGPNLGSLNRAALLSSDFIVLPIAPDLFSLQGMENFGPTLHEWRKGWARRLEALEEAGSPPEGEELDLPPGTMMPAGYVLMSFGVRDNRPVKAYDHWAAKIPATYREAVLRAKDEVIPANDPYKLAELKHYRSLMPLAMTARKPMFLLNSADGARGSHIDAVKSCYRDFLELARRIGEKTGIAVE